MHIPLQKTSLLVLAGLLVACLALFTPAAASTPTIQAYSNPSGAVVNVDGFWYDTTPATIPWVGNGWHTVSVSMDGYQPYSETVYVEDATYVVNANLIRYTPSTGSLSISSQPDGADIYLDGIYYGNAPLVIGNLWAGNHKLQAKKPGYYDLTDTIAITPADYMYTAVLDPYPPQPQYGSLQIDSDPGGAAVYVNGNYKGSTPANHEVMYVTQLSPGTYNLRIVAQDYQPYTESAVVQAGIINDIHATLVPVVAGPTRDTTGQILIYSSPAGANIYIDNAYKGLTPLTLPNIPEGSHTIILRMNGYQDLVKQVNVVGGSAVDGSGTLSLGPSSNPIPATQPTKSAAGWITVVLALGFCGVLFLVRK